MCTSLMRDIAIDRHILFCDKVFFFILSIYLTALTLCIQENPKQVLFVNSEDPDKMHHNAAFNQGLHCL